MSCSPRQVQHLWRAHSPQTHLWCASWLKLRLWTKRGLPALGWTTYALSGEKPAWPSDVVPPRARSLKPNGKRLSRTFADLLIMGRPAESKQFSMFKCCLVLLTRGWGRLETRPPVALGSSPELFVFTMSLAPQVHPSPIFLTDTENLPV